MNIKQFDSILRPRDIYPISRTICALLKEIQAKAEAKGDKEISDLAKEAIQWADRVDIRKHFREEKRKEIEAKRIKECQKLQLDA